MSFYSRSSIKWNVLRKFQNTEFACRCGRGTDEAALTPGLKNVDRRTIKHLPLRPPGRNYKLPWDQEPTSVPLQQRNRTLSTAENFTSVQEIGQRFLFSISRLHFAGVLIYLKDKTKYFLIRETRTLLKYRKLLQTHCTFLNYLDEYLKTRLSAFETVSLISVTKATLNLLIL